MYSAGSTASAGRVSGRRENVESAGEHQAAQQSDDAQVDDRRVAEQAQHRGVEIEQGRRVERIEVAIRDLAVHDAGRLLQEVALVLRVQAEADQHQVGTQQQAEADQGDQLFCPSNGQSLDRLERCPTVGSMLGDGAIWMVRVGLLGRCDDHVEQRCRRSGTRTMGRAGG